MDRRGIGCADLDFTGHQPVAVGIQPDCAAAGVDGSQAQSVCRFCICRYLHLQHTAVPAGISIRIMDNDITANPHRSMIDKGGNRLMRGVGQNGNCIAVCVRNHQISLAISIHIGCRHGIWIASCCVISSIRKSAVAIVLQHRHTIAVSISNDQISFTISIHIGTRHGIWIASRCVINARPKGAIAIVL